MYGIDFKQGNQPHFDNIGKMMLLYVKNQYAIEIRIKIQIKITLGVEKAKSSEILHLVVIEVVRCHTVLRWFSIILLRLC